MNKVAFHFLLHEVLLFVPLTISKNTGHYATAYFDGMKGPCSLTIIVLKAFHPNAEDTLCGRQMR